MALPSTSIFEIDQYVAYDLLENHWVTEILAEQAEFKGVYLETQYYVVKMCRLLLVTVSDDSGNKYYLSTYSGSTPTISLIKGNTYIFDQSHSSNDGHPLQFSTI